MEAATSTEALRVEQPAPGDPTASLSAHHRIVTMPDLYRERCGPYTGRMALPTGPRA